MTGHDTRCVCGHSFDEHKTPGAECAHSSEPSVACGCVTFRGVVDGAGHDNTRGQRNRMSEGQIVEATAGGRQCDTPLRCAYADPPYPGQSKRHYGDHPDYAGEVDHAELIERLERDFPDGWALSTSVAALPDVLALCPRPEPSKKRAWGGSMKLGTGVRICVWKRTPIPFPPSRVMWSWEPLIVRNPHWRQRHRRDFVPDVFYATQPRGFLGNDITGQKPPEFCGWMFDLLGLGPHDDLVDLYPGSGAVSKAWDAWRAQTRLAV